jgi:hypothetical protein
LSSADGIEDCEHPVEGGDVEDASRLPGRGHDAKNRLADIEDSRIGSIRCRAAALQIAAPLKHEHAADEVVRAV